MAVFKCKMCGGTLEINNETVAVCQYCGTKQTLPKLDDDRKANLYDRANHFRRNNEFDKAMGIYEQILNDDNTDAETYWSLVLCRYGIEYVEDPSSHKRIPTVNRAQFTSIFDDEDYKSALQYADGYQKDIYEQEANAINKIQKGILAISQKEEPFDVFICYKETDNSGCRTPDSVLATELYNELTREGFKVFFARITLEDKLGQEYEPYIFAALNSAKVMVVLGTKPEYFNAVWVKNEWSRYIALIKNGARKMLIPAYKDMDLYDLPEEFSHLQAQDMSKLGFMQDLIRGIKKVIDADKPASTVVQNNANVAPICNVTALLDRGYMALEDSDWDKADDFFEQVLNQDAKNAKAYLGKLMAEMQVKTQEGLKDCAELFEDRSNYQKTIRFADAKLTAFLTDVIQFIKNRNEATTREEIYNRASNSMNLNNERGYIEAAQWFGNISGYKDADTLAIECRDKAVVARKERIYKRACEVLIDDRVLVFKIFDTNIKAYEEAINDFQSLEDYKDSQERILLCQKKIEEMKTQLEKDKLEKEQKAEQERIADEERRKRNKKIAIIIAAIVAVCIALIIVFNMVILPNNKYEKANSLAKKEQYEAAYLLFDELNDYKDSATQAKNLMPKYIFEKTDVGDIIRFGLYEQDNYSSNGKEEIEWQVLEKKNDKFFLISKNILDCVSFHNDSNLVTWKNSYIRSWLNGYFIETAFNQSQQDYIDNTVIKHKSSEEYDLKEIPDTNDKIFLLHIDEINKYFKSNEERCCIATPYAKKQGCKYGEWWSRSIHNKVLLTMREEGCIGYNEEFDYIEKMLPSNFLYVSNIFVCYISKDGRESMLAHRNDKTGVRPAMWVDVNAFLNEE